MKPCSSTACLLWAAKPCRAAPSLGQGGLHACWHPLHVLDITLRLQDSSRAARAQPEQPLLQGWSRTWLGHAPRPRNGAFTCPPETLRGQAAGGRYRSPSPGGTRLEAAGGDTPTGYCPCLLSAQSREMPNASGSCSGTSQPSTCSSPVTIAVSTGLPSLPFLPLLSTLNYHNTALCQWACPGSVPYVASPREACNLSSALTPNLPCSNKCHRLIIHYANNFLVTLKYVVLSLEPFLHSAKKKKKKKNQVILDS